MLRVRLAWALIAAWVCAAPLARAQGAHPALLQLDAWRKAVLMGDAESLAKLYVASPRIVGPGQVASDLKSEIEYWQSWKTKGLKSLSAEINGGQDPQPGFHVVTMLLTLEASENGTPKKYYMQFAQGYLEQAGAWRIAAEQRMEATRLRGPAEKKDLYPADADAQKEIQEALRSAAKSHKRVMLVFGGNWCYDCHVLDAAFHLPEIAPTLGRNFIVVHVDVGEYNKNLELAKKYEVPLERGVPAAAILDSDGKLVVSQKNQEFEKARSMSPEDIVAFLNKWKPQAQ